MKRFCGCVLLLAFTTILGCEESGGGSETGSDNDASSNGTGGGIAVGDSLGGTGGNGAVGDFAYIALGDSLTEGIGDTEWTDEGVPLGFPGRLRNRFMARGVEMTLTNLGKSGWTSSDMVDGIDWGEEPLPSQLQAAIPLIEAAVANGQKAIATVWIGSNDLFGLYGWCHEPDQKQCEEENLNVYEAKLETTLSMLHDAGATVFIALLDDQSKRPVVADPAYDEVLPGLDDAAAKLMSAQVVRYNDAIAKLAAKHGAHLVDFFNTTIFETTALLDPDGVHPNAAGHEEVTTVWENVIDSALGVNGNR